MSEKSNTKARVRTTLGFGMALAVGLVIVFGLIGAYATFTSNLQTSENHGHAGTISSTVAMGTASIIYGTPGLSGYASCVEAPYGPLPTTDVVTNFTNVAPGDTCWATYNVSNTGSLPGYINDTMGPLSSFNICTTTGQVDCFIVTDSLASGTTIINAHSSIVWTVSIELAPGSTTQGIAGSYIAHLHEWIGQ